MAYWEFLLQKEGDREWLPLETAHVEISEGRYRIIAHTSYCEVAVDIRLSRVLTEQMPPKRKILKRSGQTNTNGLMVVMPFTHLTPGSWTIQCAPGSMVEPTTQWAYGVQLQVIAVESDLDYWDADTDVPIQLPTTIAANQTPLATTAPTPSDTVTPAIEATAGTSQPNMPTLLDAAPLEDLPLRLPLQHQAMVAQQGTALTLKGQVTSFSQVEGLSTEGALWVQLRNPETGAVVHRESQVLAISSLPSRFDFPIALPNQGPLRLLVGELSLWSATQPPQVLAIQGFTITLNLDALLETVANQGEGHDSPFDDLDTPHASPSSREATGSSERDGTGEIKPLAARDIPFRRVYLPSSGLTLPPVIYRPLDSVALQSPKLPPLPNQPLRSRETSEPTSPVKSLSPPPIESATQSAPSTGETNGAPDASKSTINLPAFQRSHPASTPDTSNTNPTTENAATQVETTALAFKPDFEGRFWSRLSAIAHESQRVTANLKAQMEAAGVSADTSSAEPAPENASALNFPDSKEEVTAASHEVVIYDSELNEGGIIDPLPLSESHFGTTASAPSTTDELEDFGTIPIPKLDLPEGDLVAGASLPVTVLLPPYPRRLAVKVWVTDVQSRHLADRPRWLMNWTPVEEGQKMARLQLQVPQGSLEARFEAIAIDLATQQESYKTTVARAIVPPNVPASGDENSL
ncbi:MAG: hypothetical protein AAFX01_03370 [Cyanobacteria bacterium J06638_28]